MAPVLSCPQCGGALALADEHCPSCGAAVPASLRRGVLVSRAEALAQDGHYAEAARGLEPVLKQSMEPAEAKLLWRKRAGWLQRSGRPELLDAAEAALAESLGLDDNDDLSHQLWIDLLARRGQLDKAKQWYARRLELNPADVMAQRQQQVLRLSADFKVAAPPVLNIPEAKGGLFARMFRPTPAKLGGAAVGALSSLGQLVWIMGGGMDSMAGDVAAAGGLGSLAKMAGDPWLSAIQVLLFGAYFVWGWKNRRG